MDIMHKLFFRRFSIDEFQRFKEIYKEEKKGLIKRPQYIAGIILLGGIMLYFLFRAFTVQGVGLPSIREKGGDIIGVFGGLIGCWLILSLFKASKTFKIIFLIIFGSFFSFITLFAVRTNSFEWEYLIYTVIVLGGFTCISDSIPNYFCEKILKLKQKGQ